jgi:phage antirepressor YoqD-like protein
MNKTEHHKKAILEALEKSLGVVTTACKIVGVGRTTFYQWLKDDEVFAQQVKDIENIALDFVESKLFENIRDGKTSETIFYLKTKGKNRGYVERVEQEINFTEKPIFKGIDLDVAKDNSTE